MQLIKFLNMQKKKTETLIEGIIIGVTLRDQMEREQLGGVNNG